MSAFNRILLKDFQSRSNLEHVILMSNASQDIREDTAEQFATLETNCANAIQANIELAKLSVALQDKIEEYTEVYNRVMAEQCAPDEQHCTCVPALRMEITTLQNLIKQVEANYDALQSPMPCGHLARYAFTAKNGTSFCVFCALQAAEAEIEIWRDEK